MRGYLPLIRKDSSTHMHGLAVYVKEGLLFHGMYLKKTLQILTYVFDWLYFIQCLSTFYCIDHLFCLYAWFLILISSKMSFSRSAHRLMCLSLDILASIIRTK